MSKIGQTLIEDRIAACNEVFAPWSQAALNLFKKDRNDRLKALQAEGFSLTELEKISGYPVSTIARILRRTTKPTDE